MSDLAQRLAMLSPEQRQLLAQRLKSSGAVASVAGTPDASAATIPATPRDGRLPLSFGQQRLWFLHLLDPGSPAYNYAVAFQISGPLRVAALEQGFAALLRRHEILRTAFAASTGQPFQVIAPAITLAFPVIDLSGTPVALRRAQAHDLARAEARQPFDLERAPLLRVRLLRLDATEHMLLVTIHHSICDEWSIGVLARELSLFYNQAVGKPAAALSELPIQYADFAVWQQAQLQGPALAEDIAYWKQHLNGPLPDLELPTRIPRALVRGNSGATYQMRLARPLADALKSLSQVAGVTLFMTLLAAFQTLLARYSDQDDIIVGSPIANRSRVELEGLIGFFVNTLVLRTDLSGNPSFREVLRRVREVALGAYAHQDLPFEYLVEAIQPERDTRRPPLFQVMFIFQPAGPSDLGFDGLTVQSSEIGSGAAKFDLSLSMWETGDEIMGALLYHSELFDEATIARMAGHFQTLVAEIISDPDRPIARLALLSAVEQRALLTEWNQDAADYTSGLCVHTLFEAQAARTPDAVAIVLDGACLTYRELDERANQLAHELGCLGAGPELAVGMCLERSLAAIVALLGTLKSGAAYVPLDPAYPRDRLHYLAADAQVAVVLTHERLATSFAGQSAQVVCLDRDATRIAARPRTPNASGVRGQNTAYVIYTSGSTGQPKGVMVAHEVAANHCIAIRRTFDLSARDRMLQFASLSFDVSLEQIIAPLLVGAQVVLRGAELWEPATFTRSVATAGLSVVNLTPAYWRGWTDACVQHAGEPAPPTLRLVIVGGDLVTPDAVQRWRQTALGQVGLLNAYGPTEATITAATCDITPAAGRDLFMSRVPIGRPVDLRRIYILDRHGSLVPAGVAGELYIGGPLLARGYLGRPDLTAERFVPNPFAQKRLEIGDWRLSGAQSPISNLQSPISNRLYRTGDLARYRPDGTIEYLGRLDNQVKLRGFRIELGEIEAVLGRHPVVGGCAVVLREDRPGERRLVAYLVPAQEQRTKPVLSEVEGNKEQRTDRTTERKGVCNTPPAAHTPSTDNGQLTIVDLRQFLKERLPDYMIPSAFVLLDRLPLTPNGKIDRRALPPPALEQSEPAVAGTTPIEEIVAAIWADVLRLERVGIHDNFFDLGGHSLLATQVIARVRDTFKAEVPLRGLIERPTVAELAASIERALHDALNAPEQPPPLMPREPSLGGEGAKLPLALAQQRLWFLDQLYPNNPVYTVSTAMYLSGPLDRRAITRSLNAIVARHEVLRTTFVIVDDQPIQAIAPAGPVSPYLIDLQALPTLEREAAALGVAEAALRRPFDLARGPLFRLLLLQIAPDEHVLLLTMHHIISDGWSISIFMRELSLLYQSFITGTTAALPALPVQYADYAIWQRGRLQGVVLETQLAYWRRQLADLPILQLPTSHPRPGAPTFQGRVHTFEIPAQVSKAINALSRRAGVTLFMTLLAAFQVLLARYSGQEDVAVATPIAGRTHGETENLIGFFVNTLVLRTDLSGNPTLRALLGQVREVCIEAYAHQDLPFDQVVEALQPERDLSRHPLVQVMFVMHNVPVSEGTLHNLIERPVPFASPPTQFDLNLNISERGDTLVGAMQYSTDLFEEPMIARMAAHLGVLLAEIAGDPDRPIFALPILTAAEQQQIIEWQGPAQGYPAHDCVHDLFAAQAARTPDAIAVIYDRRLARSARSAMTAGDEQISYAELDRRTNQLAQHLRSLGIGPERLVGICIERSIAMVVGILGVLKAGGAYVPLDPSYPAERLAFMLEDSGTSVLLTQREVGDWRLEVDAPEKSPISKLQPPTQVYLDTDWDQIAQAGDDLPDSGITADNLAYVIYTSGSTGRPKGTMIPHRGLVNYLRWCIEAYEVVKGFGAPIHSSISFDLTVTSLFAPLLSGRPIRLLPERDEIEALGHVLNDDNHFSLVKITPAHLELLNHMVPADRAAHQTRAFIIGGEALRAEEIDFWRTHAPATRLINEYGPTETVVGCCVYEVPWGFPATGAIPIGTPIANTQIYLLDPFLNPVPVGVPGQLFVGGAGVARGYLGRPDLTAERFVPNPFAQERLEIGDWRVAGADATLSNLQSPISNRLYRTGDLARYRPDGTIEYLGRSDNQVKLRGFRIELGEIEAVLGRHPAVGGCAVLLREERPGERRLIAYLVPAQEQRTDRTTERKGVLHTPPAGDERVHSTIPPAAHTPSTVNGQLTIVELRQFLKERLPDYMIPSAFVLLDRLPLTPNGKVDRRALPAPGDAASEPEQPFVAPRTPVEQAVAALWSEVLRLERVGIHDNFFAVGGHSLLATQLITRVRRAFQIALPLRSIFEAPTVAELARSIIANEPKPGQVEKIAQILNRIQGMSAAEIRSALRPKSK